MLRKSKPTTAFILLCAVILIFDSQTALEGAQKGIVISINTVIPALFPLFVLTSLLTVNISETSTRLLRPLGKICGLLSGSEHLFLLGIFGGYPTGAVAISEAMKQGKISSKQAKHMLMFCNNAGPALIFGICGASFSNKWCAWCLWAIQIVSAVFVGWLFRVKESHNNYAANSSNNCRISYAMDCGIRSIARVCGWVIIFRTLIAVVQKRLDLPLSQDLSALFLGVIELTNGCIALETIEPVGMRFIIASFILTFGGLCVAMQTASVIEGLDIKSYLAGKMIQSVCSVFLSSIIQTILFQGSDSLPSINAIMNITALLLSFITLYIHILKKRVDFRSKVIYNQEKRNKARVHLCSFGRK